jgi:membrane dipeptidase
MFIVDGHLDLGYNVDRGRDVTLAAEHQPACGAEIASVGLPDLRAGGVKLICATVFCMPHSERESGYRTPDEAHAMALRQLEWYRGQHEAENLRVVTRGEDPASADAADSLSAIILLEGGDAIRASEDVQALYDKGVRIVGLAWKRTRHAGGTGEPGGLTDLGRATVRTMDRLGIIHDASHLAEQSFWDLLEMTRGPVIASHSNCRAIVPSDRQLSDEMIRAIAARGGIIGINFYDKFLLPPPEHGKRRATLQDVAAHVRHVCNLVGSARHVGLGTDMDGGLGRDQIPQEISTSADLPRVAEALGAAGFADGDVAGIMGGNWLRFFRRSLGQPA